MNPEEKIIREVSLLTMTPEYIVKDIVDFQFRFIKGKIEEGTYKTINIKHLGKFIPKPRFLKKEGKYGNSSRT